MLWKCRLAQMEQENGHSDWQPLGERTSGSRLIWPLAKVIDYSVLPPARNTCLLTTFLAAVLQEAAITIAKIRKYVRGFRFEKKAKCAIDMNLRGVVGQAVSPGVCKARSWLGEHLLCEYSLEYSSNLEKNSANIVGSSSEYSSNCFAQHVPGIFAQIDEHCPWQAESGELSCGWGRNKNKNGWRCR